MNQKAESELQSRLARLELQNKQLRLAVVLLALASLGWGAWQWKSTRRADSFAPVITQDLILIDETGNQRAVLSADGSRTALQLRDSLGRVRAELDVTPLGPGLTLKDSTGTVRALLAVGDENPYFGLTNDDGDDLVILPKLNDPTGSDSSAIGGK